MSNNLLQPGKDPMGNAIADYFVKGKAAKLRVFSSQFDENKIENNEQIIKMRFIDLKSLFFQRGWLVTQFLQLPSCR